MIKQLTNASKQLIKVLKWIKENGYTNDRCGIHFNISFNDEKMGSSFLTRLNRLKFILDFDEDKIWKDYPNRKNSVYAKSIKYCLSALYRKLSDNF